MSINCLGGLIVLWIREDHLLAIHSISEKTHISVTILPQFGLRSVLRDLTLDFTSSNPFHLIGPMISFVGSLLEVSNS